MNLGWLPFKRGTDGLTRHQRARYARAYLDGPGKSPEVSAERTARLREVGVWQPGKDKP